MPEYIEPKIRDLCEQESEESVDILLGVSGDREELAQRIRELDERVDRPEMIGRASLRVSTPITRISDICELEGTKSIELDARDVEVYNEAGDSGNA